MTPPRAPTLLIAMPLTLGACSGASGTQPHEMSVAQHQAAATQEEAQADKHAGPEQSKETCPRSIGTTGGACWSQAMNPTENHKVRARRHRDLAAKHRAAAQALVDAESRACRGVPDEDRDMSPFAHTEDIRAVTRVEVPTTQTPYVEPRSGAVGARITFRAVPGMTVEWLQSVVDCHLARNAALGHDVPEMSYCPLTLKGVTASVSSVGNGFALDVVSDDPATSEEVWRRAQQLNPTP